MANTANGSWYCVQIVPWVLPLSSSSSFCLAPRRLRRNLQSFDGMTTVPWV